MNEVSDLELELLEYARRDCENTFEIVDENTNPVAFAVIHHCENERNNTKAELAEINEKERNVEIAVRPIANEFKEKNRTNFENAGSCFRRVASASLLCNHKQQCRKKLEAVTLHTKHLSLPDLLDENNTISPSEELEQLYDRSEANSTLIKDKSNYNHNFGEMYIEEKRASNKVTISKQHSTKFAVNRSSTKSKIKLESQNIKRTPVDKNIDAFYLHTVACGEWRQVEALFNRVETNSSFYFDKDSVNCRGWNALVIAIDNEDLIMLKLLLNNKVKLLDSLFHAININFLEGVEAILDYDPCIDQSITSDNCYFEKGMTPLILAAHKNNYKILKLLWNYGHQMKETKDFQWQKVQKTECFQSQQETEGSRTKFFNTKTEAIDFQNDLESFNQRRWIFAAQASPAYITLRFERENSAKEELNVLEYCLQLIENIRKYSKQEVECFDFYKDLQDQVENFMCSLLNQIRSSKELADFFEYDSDINNNKNGACCGKTRASLKVCKPKLNLLELVCNCKLIKFVTHQKSQLALSHMRFRSTPFMSNSSFKMIFFELIFGLLFPVWCFCNLVAPCHPLGGIITSPNVAYAGHVASEVIFLILIVANVATKSPATEYLGAPPTLLEWLILFWILGKFWQEIKNIRNRGLKLYFIDFWNYVHIVQLVVFVAVAILRIVDFAIHVNDQERKTREQWTPLELRLISVGMLGWAYVFAFFRALCLIRTNRIIGPLQVSVAKMMVDFMQFFCVFIIVIFSFSLALTEIFWYYDTPKGREIYCVHDNVSFVNSTECEVLFSEIRKSLGDLFWSSFGYSQWLDIPFNNQIVYAYSVGVFLLGIYHIIAVLILINMLIAMTAKTFEAISMNRDVEWKFQRTVVWIRFVQREFTRPPPMNLIPHPYTVLKKLRQSFRKLYFLLCHCQTEKQLRNRDKIKRRRKHSERIRHLQFGDREQAGLNQSRLLKKSDSEKVMLLLIERYKYLKLLKDCGHCYHHHGDSPRRTIN